MKVVQRVWLYASRAEVDHGLPRPAQPEPKHAGLSDWFGLPQTQRDTEIKRVLSVDPFHWLITGPDRCLFFASWRRGATYTVDNFEFSVVSTVRRRRFVRRKPSAAGEKEIID